MEPQESAGKGTADSSSEPAQVDLREKAGADEAGRFRMLRAIMKAAAAGRFRLAIAVNKRKRDGPTTT